MTDNVFVFVYHVKPTSSCSEFGKVGGAYADIWVLDSDRDMADIRARSYLMDYRWQVVEKTDELAMNDEQILHYREVAQISYSRAKMEGLSAFFSAYPVKERDDHIIEIYSLPEPPESPETKH